MACMTRMTRMTRTACTVARMARWLADLADPQTMASPPSVARLCSTFLAASLFQALFHRPTIVLFYEVFCVLLLVKFAPPIFRRLLSRKTVFLLKIARSKSAGNHGAFVGQI